MVGHFYVRHFQHPPLQSVQCVQESRYLKMEKADILEMTVAYLRTVYRCSAPTSADSDDDVTTMTSSDDVKSGRYAAGYRQCVLEVAQYLGDVCSAEGVDVVRTKLMRHLTAILHTKRPPVHPSSDDDVEQLCPVVTSFSPEVAWGRSCEDKTSSSSPAAGSEPQVDENEASPPRVSDAAVDYPDPGLDQMSTASSRSTSSEEHSAMLAEGDHLLTHASSVACIHLPLPLTARSADTGVWRPW